MVTIKAYPHPTAWSSGHSRIDPIAQVIDPNDQDITSGLDFYRAGALDSAAICFQRVSLHSPNRWRAEYLLGAIDVAGQLWQNALLHYQSALDMAHSANVQDRSLIYVAIGRCYEQAGDRGRARQHYMSGLNLDPQSTSAAQSLKRLGERTRAD
ncbi:MAG: tetratricopeptide repeat protein [Candidatus Zixiibacteriota bacterium]